MKGASPIFPCSNFNFFIISPMKIFNFSSLELGFLTTVTIKKTNSDIKGLVRDLGKLQRIASQRWEVPEPGKGYPQLSLPPLLLCCHLHWLLTASLLFVSEHSTACWSVLRSLRHAWLKFYSKNGAPALLNGSYWQILDTSQDTHVWGYDPSQCQAINVSLIGCKLVSELAPGPYSYTECQ